MRETIITSDRVLLPYGTVSEATIRCEGGRILEVESRRCSDATIDAGEMLILPAIIDLHNDAFERQIHPRPAVAIELEIALADTDRQMAANGIATAFHGLTVTWVPGPRDLTAGRAFIDALARVKPQLRCDTRLHLRHETLSIDTVEAAVKWVESGLVNLVAMNDHSRMVERALARPQVPASSLQYVGIPEAEYRQLAARMFARRGEIPDTLHRLAAVAREHRVTLASHDDATPEERSFYRDMGCRICEFPGDRETAEAAIAAGDEVVLGGPNILRGGSHCGRVSASEMVGLGLCTAICTDFYFPSILYAPFRLAAAGVRPFAECWNLVSRGPARAAGLTDRGAIETGMRADLLLVDDSDRLHPDVHALFVEGVPVYAGARAGARVGSLVCA